jgi:glycosyltransferase involved in cell wall biosynthesis
VDGYLANSSYVARRIEKLYRRPAHVIHPPVEIDRYYHTVPREEFFVTVSRFVPYKRVDLIVEAFSRTKKPLIVIGDGPDRAKVKRAAGPSVKLLGYQPDEVVTDYLQRARGFVFAADEDFGIAPVEAQAAGCPVIAYGKGGAMETVVGWPDSEPTGVFFDAQTPEALEAAVELFEAHEGEFEPEACRRNAERFGKERFRRQFRSTMEDLWGKFQRGERLEPDGGHGP